MVHEVNGNHFRFNTDEVFMNSTSLENVAVSERSDHRAQSILSLHTEDRASPAPTLTPPHSPTETTTPDTEPTIDELELRLLRSQKHIDHMQKQREHLLRLTEAFKDQLDTMEQRRLKNLRASELKRKTQNHDSVEDIKTSVSALKQNMENVNELITYQRDLEKKLDAGEFLVAADMPNSFENSQDGLAPEVHLKLQKLDDRFNEIKVKTDNLINKQWTIDPTVLAACKIDDVISSVREKPLAATLMEFKISNDQKQNNLLKEHLNNLLTEIQTLQSEIHESARDPKTQIENLENSSSWKKFNNVTEKLNNDLESFKKEQDNLIVFQTDLENQKTLLKSTIDESEKLIEKTILTPTVEVCSKTIESNGLLTGTENKIDDLTRIKRSLNENVDKFENIRNKLNQLTEAANNAMKKHADLEDIIVSTAKNNADKLETNERTIKIAVETAGSEEAKKTMSEKLVEITLPKVSENKQERTIPVRLDSTPTRQTQEYSSPTETECLVSNSRTVPVHLYTTPLRQTQENSTCLTENARLGSSARTVPVRLDSTPMTPTEENSRQVQSQIIDSISRTIPVRLDSTVVRTTQKNSPADAERTNSKTRAVPVRLDSTSTKSVRQYPYTVRQGETDILDANSRRTNSVRVEAGPKMTTEQRNENDGTTSVLQHDSRNVSIERLMSPSPPANVVQQLLDIISTLSASLADGNHTILRQASQLQAAYDTINMLNNRYLSVNVEGNNEQRAAVEQSSNKSISVSREETMLQHQDATMQQRVQFGNQPEPQRQDRHPISEQNQYVNSNETTSNRNNINVAPIYASTINHDALLQQQSRQIPNVLQTPYHFYNAEVASQYASGNGYFSPNYQQQLNHTSYPTQHQHRAQSKEQLQSSVYYHQVIPNSGANNPMGNLR